VWRLAAPYLLEELVAPRAVAVEAVPQRILLVVVLVVLLGGIEGRERHDAGDDRLREAPARGERGLRGFGCGPLRVVVHEDDAPILHAAIDELPTVVGRIDLPPEDLEQPLVRHLRRVVGHLDGFDVPRRPGRHLLVGRIRLGASSVARNHARDTGQLLEGRLHAPEAAAGKRGDGGVRNRGETCHEADRQTDGEGTHEGSRVMRCQKPARVAARPVAVHDRPAIAHG
jgi:hypothetical protein